jgi:uncharacterized protein (TIGR02246 family)
VTDRPLDNRFLDSPERIPEAFVEAWNRRDARALAALFDEDAEFVNVVGLWWHDRAAIERAHAYGLERIFPDSTLTLVRTTVKRLRDDVAVVHARMRLTGQTPIDGIDDPQVRTTIFSFVVHRSESGWSCASAHNTDVVPGAETNVIDASGQFRSADYRRT